MSNMHRIKWIDKKIRNGNYPNCKNISDKFEISNRQALRDIEYLKCSLNGPIEYSAKRRGYFYSDKTYSIPTEMFTEKESSLLSDLIENYNGSESSRIKKLLPLFQISDKKQKIDNISEVLKIALDKKMKIEIKMKCLKYENRKLIPLEIIFEEWKDKLVFYTEDDGSKGILSVDEIISVTLTRDRFNKQNPATISWRELKLYSCKLKFLQKVDLSDYSFNYSIKKEWVELEFESSNQIISYLLAKTFSFRIIEPKWLRVKLLKKIKNLQNNNMV